MNAATASIQPYRYPSLSEVQRLAPDALLYPPPQDIFPGVASYMNYPYAMVPGNRMLRLDLHVPKGADGPVPLVVYASGGGWMIAIKQHGPWRFLLDHGYAVASIEYRLSDEAKFPKQVFDVKAAVRWLRANAGRLGYNTDEIAGWGGSAGAFLMAMAAVTNGRADFEGDVGENLEQSSAISCVIDQYGPTDLAKMAEDSNHIEGLAEPFGLADSIEARLLGFAPASDPDRAAFASVAHHVSAPTVPFLIMHGTGDTRLGIGQSVRLYQALTAVGADVTFEPIEGANHAGPEFFSDESNEIVLNFLKRVFAPPSLPASRSFRDVV